MIPFAERIKDFNKLYGLPCGSVPGLPGDATFRARMAQFRDMLATELTEADDVTTEIGSLNTLTALADWLGDIQVYCASEMMRYGIPIEPILQIIMDSNMSKLGADGKPIIIDGKIQKGPGYWKPEPKIREYLHVLRMAGGLL